MCITPSNAVNPKELWRSPRIQDTPSGHPVSLMKEPKTNDAGWNAAFPSDTRFPAVARPTTEIVAAPTRDQKRAPRLIAGRSR